MYEVLRQFPTGPVGRIEELASAGGFSGASFWRVEAGSRPLCLRCWPPPHPDRSRLTFIHQVLQHAASRGLPWLPLPLQSLAGETFVEHEGRLWELTPWMPGDAELDDPPRTPRLTAAMQALARFHLATTAFPGGSRQCPPGWRQRYDFLVELESGQLGRILSAARPHDSLPSLPEQAVRYATLFATVAPRIRSRLESALMDKVLLQPCVRDVRRDHLLFVGDEVSGIVDFGALRMDCPAGDVARLLGSFAGDSAELRSVALAAYDDIRSLTEEDKWRVATYDASNVLLSVANWLRWTTIEKRRFERPAAVCALIDGWLQRLETAAQRQTIADL